MNAAPSVHILHRLDSGPIPEGPGEIRAFVPVHNEAARLPWFLKYHRRLGVDRFFIIDNGSDDGTVEFLLGQPRCHVFRTRGTYAESQCGIVWQTALLDEYGAGRWCLILDADEMFVYPGCEEHDLHTFSRFNDVEGSRGVFAFLLDMYSDGAIADAKYTPGTPFLDTCPCLDKDYHWVTGVKPRFRLGGGTAFPPMSVLGGPRLRVFYADHADAGFAGRQLHRVNRIVAQGLGHTQERPPYLPKIPLVRWDNGVRYLSSHKTTPIQLSSVTGALLHFKFFSDFHARVEAVRQRQRSGLSRAFGQYQSEYARYLGLLERSEGVSLHYAGSCRYRDTTQIVGMGLLKDPRNWRSFLPAEPKKMSDEMV